MVEKQNVFYKQIYMLSSKYHNTQINDWDYNEYQAHVYRGMEKWDYHKFFDAVYNVLLD